jgi:predicted acyl esterase
MTACLFRRAVITMRLGALLAAGAAFVPARELIAQQEGPAPAPYEYTRSRRWLRMPDGVRLAVTYWRPVPRTPGETFPVLLEYLPYRKEDSFYERDFPLYDWFVRRGFIMAKVDVRGTGSSEGHLPEREYSDIELEDADRIIAALAKLQGSNGAVGMWGISWGGFNAIQIAMRRPPALKAIIALMATDDLYHDDIHYIDGVLHIDEFALQIDHENALPAPPAYPTDSAYFRDRFEAEPWIFTYLKHSRDGEWWRRKSLRFDYGAITIPAFLIGGQLDGYRDALPRMLDSLHAPVKALLGPWNHSFPDDAEPGPEYEWREVAVRWWNQWLRNQETGIMAEPRLTLFVRDGHPPDAALKTTPGEYRFEDWPITRTRLRRWYPSGDRRLSSQLPVAAPSEAALTYVPGSGTATPVWWNDPTGSMARDDGESLIFDSPVLDSTIEIIGFPRVALRASAPVTRANWTVRLEDVGPGGQVSLVTGALIQGAQRDSRLEPKPLTPNQLYDLTSELHFTTWTFRPGHRIRLAVSNAQFPMAWPTPFPMVTRLRVDDAGTMLELPVTPPDSARRLAPLLPIGAHAEAPDARTLSAGGEPGAVVRHDAERNVTMVDFLTHYQYAIGSRRIDNLEQEHYEVADADPARARFEGKESHDIALPNGRRVRLETLLVVQSDTTDLHVKLTRTIRQNGRVLRTKTWEEAIPRGMH